ncbi:hypothetical protein T08_15666 [Trichinella sp. T8]|nr:hypothetical protein T08_15666 [Trichinella sp. T8]
MRKDTRWMFLQQLTSALVRPHVQHRINTNTDLPCNVLRAARTLGITREQLREKEQSEQRKPTEKSR